MVIRFGALPACHADARGLIEMSLADSGWSVSGIREAGSARGGRRQADAFLRTRSESLIESDVWCVRRQAVPVLSPSASLLPDPRVRLASLLQPVLSTTCPLPDPGVRLALQERWGDMAAG